MFKKKFDYNDINNFLPDNKTVGTVDFFNKKFKNNMPDYICELLAVETLVEDKEEKEKQRQEILNKKKEYTNKLLAELEERANENKDNLETEIKNLSIDNIPAIIKKCGIKTAEKLAMNLDELNKIFNKDPDSKKNFERNQQLIDFNYIDEKLKKEYLQKFKFI